MGRLNTLFRQNQRVYFEIDAEFAVRHDVSAIITVYIEHVK